tara:strand:+ start:1249 stop:2145 length:897 start_codon:yes stop_codon:yes gene_type:complete
MNIHKTNIDFTSKTRVAVLFSSVLIVFGLISLLINNGPNLSIDFTGGTVIRMEFNSNIKIDEIRSLLSTTSLNNAEITQIFEIGNPNKEFRIKTNISEDIGKLNKKLLELLKNFNPEIRKIENVGPKLGGEIQLQATYAICLALIMLMIYIGFRFDRFYAFGSVLAIIHDVMFTLSIFSILQLEIDLSIIAAFLTIVGYSLNDTIVIFDRFRENSEKDLDLELNDLANLSLNQTLSRTIITSLTTLIVVIILYYIGGEVLKYFAFALIIGVLVGTYSSIFVASPFMLYLKSKYKIEEK